MNHTTRNPTHTSHPQFTPEAKLKGIRYITNQSKLLIEHMSAVRVCPSQLTTLLEIFDISESTSQSSIVKICFKSVSCLRKKQKELGINHTSLSTENAIGFLNRYCCVIAKFMTHSNIIPKMSRMEKDIRLCWNFNVTDTNYLQFLD